jgi:hypothetical protein
MCRSSELCEQRTLPHIVHECEDGTFELWLRICMVSSLRLPSSRLQTGQMYSFSPLMVWMASICKQGNHHLEKNVNNILNNDTVNPISFSSKLL